MASSTVVPDQPFHVRSISLPSRSHPTALKVEEDLHKLKACMVSSSMETSFVTVEKICNALRGLGDFYYCIEDLLCLMSIQHPFYSNQNKWLEKELDGSFRLLDLCGTTKDMLVSVNKRIQESQSVLRRRGGMATEEKSFACGRFNKEAQKIVKKCNQALKQMASKCESRLPIDEDFDFFMVIRVLAEARVIAVSILQAIASFLSTPRLNQKASRWPFVSKAIHNRKMVHAGNQENTSEVGEQSMVKDRNQLEALNVDIEDLATGLDCLFRRLIQNRVSLLNFLSC